jgi:hypothetical protein
VRGGAGRAPPIGQQRRVQSFAAEQRTNAAWYGGNSFRLREDALLVLCSEATPLGFGNYFGIARRGQCRSNGRFGCRCTVE